MAQTTSDERIYRRGFWLGVVHARPVAVFRLALASVVLVDLVERLRDFHTFYTDRGLFPRALALGDATPVVGWTAFAFVGSGWGVGLLYALALAAAAALLVGYRTRLANLVVWILLTSLQRRNPWVLDGCDDVERVLLFWLLWADAGAQLSLDVVLGRRPRSDAVPALPVRLIQLQIAAIYFFAALEKSDVGWYGGGALEHILQNPELTRPLGSWLLRAPRLLHVASVATPPTEMAMALLMLAPFRAARSLAFGLAVALHGLIFAFMAVGLFSIAMPLVVTIVRFPPPVTAPENGRRWWHAIPAALLLLTLSCMSRGLLDRPCSGPTRVLVHMLALDQHWTMFSRMPGEMTLEWRAPGEFADGNTTEDVFSLALPRLRSPLRTWVYARWLKVRESMRQSDVLEAMAQYVCRRVNYQRSVKLVSFRFERTARFQPRLNQSPHAPPENGVVLLHDCLATPAGGAGE